MMALDDFFDGWRERERERGGCWCRRFFVCFDLFFFSLFSSWFEYMTNVIGIVVDVFVIGFGHVQGYI